MNENKNLWIWAFVVVAALFVFGNFGIRNHTMMGFGMGFGSLFMILFFGGIICLVYVLIKATQTNTQNKEEDTATILKKRYSKGEITKKKYEEMRKELSK